MEDSRFDAIRENLNEVLSKVFIDDEIIRAFGELAYTASETGLIPFEFHDPEDMADMIRLVRLAEKFKNGVPEELKM